MEELWEDKQKPTVLDTYAMNFGRRVLHARFPQAVYDAVGMESAIKEVMWPFINFGVFVTIVLLVAMGVLCFLLTLEFGSAPSCVVFMSRQYQPATSALWADRLTVNTTDDWNVERLEVMIQDVTSGNQQKYEYLEMLVVDSKAHVDRLDAWHPWNFNKVSTWEFPVYVHMAQLNSVNMHAVILSNIVLQLLIPFLLVLTCSALWGYSKLPFAGPGTILYLCGSLMVFSVNASLALSSPPEMTPSSLTADEHRRFEMCKFNDEGLSSLAWVLGAEMFLALLLLWEVAAYGKPICNLVNIAKRFNEIQVIPKGGDAQCMICLEQLSSDSPTCPPEQREAGECWTLPCGHTFHKACIFPWLIRRGSCPTCRANI